MKIRNLEKLEDSLDADLSWRKRELTTIKFMIKEAKNQKLEILTKSAIMLLYAHWEGHIKHCALAYLNYLNHQGLNCNKIADNFLIVSLGEEFSSGFSIKKLEWQKKIFMYLKKTDENKFKVQETKIIDTESNLQYKTLKNILEQLGLDYSNFESKENLLDQTILNNRNKIAHGERMREDEALEIYKTMGDQLLEMIEEFHRQVRNAASNKKYLKNN